ncbi:TonB-dependent receptor [Marinimicrobium sp. ARAG 43.8]|uniref:TonB-dependent receptor n=1 Tax=Marinimicrobium sp. ARAG 43.8 TaxID=3418719 RepID=UPI003CECDFF2
MSLLMRSRDCVFFKKSRLSNVIKHSVVGVALASANLMAVAQEEPRAIEEFVVTGSYAKSLQSAAELKRSNVGFSDSILATDIADFPEQNLAEALQRIPGVTIERNKGLGSRVNVRSLPTNFTHVSINDLATASGSGGRDVEFDIFASEIIQSVTVQKSPTAADEEGGIAGSVDIRTARPFDYDERQIVVSAEGAYNSISEETDPKFAFLASDTFGDWGALVSVASSQRTNRTDSNSGVDFRPLSRWLEKSGDSQFQSDQAAAVLERDTGVVINDRTDSDETSRVVFINKVGDRAYLNDQDKLGATASLQYQPSNSFNLVFDAMVGRYDSDEDEYDAAAYSASSISTLETVHAYDDTTLAEHGLVVLTDASYADTQHELLSKENNSRTDYSQYSMAMEWDVGGWRVEGLLGLSSAEKELETTNLKHTAYAPSRTRFTATGGETIPSDSSDTIDMYNSPESYIFDYYDVSNEVINDDKYAAQLDFSYPTQWTGFSALSEIQFGVRYTDKSKDRNRGETRVEGPEEGDSSWSRSRILTDSELQVVTDMVPGGRYLPEDDRNISWAQVPNSYARSEFRYPGFAVNFAESEFYQVDEEVLSLYAMADFDFHIGPWPTTANVGVRSVDTEVLSFGYQQVQSDDGSLGYTAEPVSKKGDYSDVLPSLNMTVDLAENLMLRAAASQTLIRPALGDIAYKRSVSLSEFKYFDGNPDLEPTYADQWELGLEWYPVSGGVLSASYFEKEIEGVVREELTGQAPDVIKYNADGTLDGTYDFDIYQKVNAEGSYDVSGVELVAQFSLGILSETLADFGVNSNLTLLDSSLTGASDLGIPTAPEGLADKTYNLTFYYDNSTVDARLSYNYKDEYVESIGYSMYPVYRDAYGQLDFSAGYRINDNLKVTLDAINVTDEATKGYTMNEAFPTMYEFSGRRISLGVRASF